MATTISEENGMFQEVYLLSVNIKGGSALQFAGKTNDVSYEFGDKDGEGVVMGNGGRLWGYNPMGDTTITVKIFPLDVDSTNLNDMAQFFTGGTYDASAPIAQIMSLDRDIFRVVQMWTDDATATTAEGISASGSAARRYVFTDARCISYKPGNEDGRHFAEVTFKLPAFNKAAAGLITFESVQAGDSQVLAALAAYT